MQMVMCHYRVRSLHRHEVSSVLSSNGNNNTGISAMYN